MNTEHRHRLLVVAAHPVQYAAPVFRAMAAHPRLDLLVVYCSLQGAEEGLDPEFGVKVAWDVPLLEGYRWVHVPNRSPVPGTSGFFRLINPGLWGLIRRGRFDAVVLLTGYVRASFWITLCAAKLSRQPILFGTDAHELRPRDGGYWKRALKRGLWPTLFKLADIVLAPSTGAVQLMRNLGIAEERIALTPFVVNNPWWKERSASVNRDAVRHGWNVPASASVVLFCGKLQPWKEPMQCLAAFAKAQLHDAYLVFAGEGPLRPLLEEEAKRLGVGGQVRHLGFVNQSALPGVYRAADIIVVPSRYEPFGLVVNEAMLCGCPALVSDHVGARFDLILEGVTGMVFPFGDVEDLAGRMRQLLTDQDTLKRMSGSARKRMESWGPDNYISALAAAIERARRLRSVGQSGA